MNSRERVLTALDHKQPDRVPIDLGGSIVTTITAPAYKSLRWHLNLAQVPIRLMDLAQQIVLVDEDVMHMIGADVMPVFANEPAGYRPQVAEAPDGTLSFVDEFGATLRRPPSSFYYDWQEFPLPEPSIEDLQKVPWPDPEDAARYEGLRGRVRKLRSTTDKALFGMAPYGYDLFNQLLRSRGMENGLMDLVLHQDFAEAFLDRMMQIILRSQELFLNEVGDLIDVYFTSDDLTGQFGPLISPLVYRAMIKPRWARVIAEIKRRTPAKILYHSCGAIHEFLDDLVEIGVDILNPVQVSAAGMDTKALKQRYGNKLSFWGGGCNTQLTLPYGKPVDIREEVRRRILDLGPHGGYVFNPVHNIQPLVDPRNIVAMFQAALKFGRYPLREK